MSTMNTAHHTPLANDAEAFFPEGVPSARQFFAEYYRKLVEEGRRSAREEPLVEHDEVMRGLDAIIARYEKKSA